MSVFGLRRCWWGCGGVDGLVKVMGGWCVVMYVCVVSGDYAWILQIHVSVYCVQRIPAHPKCTQCSIIWQFIDICFLTYICLWHISQI